MTRTAIIAGTGALPRTIAEALDAPVWVSFDAGAAPAGATPLAARIEQLGALFEALRGAGVTHVTFAGAMARPQIDPGLLDAHAMRLAMALGKGDDGLLREVLAVFTAAGFIILSAAEARPDLVLGAGTHWGRAMTEKEEADAARASAVLDALGPLDVGQGAVAAAGQMLGIETLQGTDALLDFVAATPARLRRAKGVFVKRPKPGQDLRIDMPTIGPDTIARVAAAGLGGLVIAAGGVIVLDQPATRRAVEEAGLFLQAR